MLLCSSSSTYVANLCFKSVQPGWFACLKQFYWKMCFRSGYQARAVSLAVGSDTVDDYQLEMLLGYGCDLSEMIFVPSLRESLELTFSAAV